MSKFTSFKDFVNGKISGGFKVVDAVKIEDAIKNSKRNYGCDVNGNLLLFSTDLFELGDRIFSFVKAKLMVLKRKF